MFCQPTYLSLRRMTQRFSHTLTIALALLFFCLLTFVSASRHNVKAYGRLAIAAPSVWTLQDGAFSLPEAKVDTAYEFQFHTEGGLAPLKWSVASGALPPGLGLDEQGKLSGTPTQAKADAYAFVVEVADSSRMPQRFSLSCLLVVKAAPLRIVTGVSTLRIISSPASANSVELQATPPNGGTDAHEPVLADASAGAVLPTPQAAVAMPPPTAAPIATATPDQTKVKVCGKLRPASLDRTLAWLRVANIEEPQPSAANDPKKYLRDRFYGEPVSDPAKDPKNLGRTPQTNILSRGRVNDRCETNSAILEGAQKQAVIHVLRDALTGLDRKSPKEVLGSLPGRQEYSSLSRESIERQILLLEQYLGKVTVRMTKPKANSTTEVETWETLSDADGNFEFDPPSDGVYTISSEADHFKTQQVVFLAKGKPVRIYLPIDEQPVSLLTRAVVGYQQAGAAAAKIEQNYFFDLFVSKSLPWRQTVHPDFGERFKVWTSARTLSVQQSGEFKLGDFSTSLVSGVANLQAKEAVRVIDALGGIELRLTGNNALLPSFDRDTKQKFSLSLIVGGGFVTPTDPKEQIFKFKIPDQKAVEGLPKELQNTPDVRRLLDLKRAGFDNVALVADDRDRFFRQYYAGLRLQTFFFNRHNVPLQRFPAQLDFAIGQNEYVSGGRLHGPIIRVDAYFPLPYDNLQFINLYGTVLMRPTRVTTGSPLVLEPVLDAQGNFDNKFPAPNTALLPVHQFDRDYYKFGVGFDLISFIKKYKDWRTSEASKAKAMPTPTPAPPANAGATGVALTRPARAAGSAGVMSERRDLPRH